MNKIFPKNNVAAKLKAPRKSHTPTGRINEKNPNELITTANGIYEKQN